MAGRFQSLGHQLLGVTGVEIDLKQLPGGHLLQSELGEAREIAGTFCADEGIIRHIGREQDFSGRGELGAEIAPGLHWIGRHGATQSPPFTSSAAPVISLA